jgi:DNA replication protein DnaC
MIDENKDCWLTGECNHIDCDCFCIKRFKLNFLYEQALVSPMQRKHIDLRLDASNTDRDEFIQLKNIEDNIIDFVNSGKNLFIHSEITGNGKTAWTLRLLQSYFNKTWAKADLSCEALFIHVPTFLLALKDNITVKSEYIEHIKENVLTCPLVIWDEIGIKTATPFEMENLLSMINTRIDNGKANMYTSNLKPTDLYDKLGDRLYSRIINLSTDIEFKGFDKRAIIRDNKVGK